MLVPIALSALLAASPGAKTLWLVQPLYPGQEQLQSRTEQAVRQLVTAEERRGHVVGKAELLAYLKDRPLKTPNVLGCLGDGSCRDPLDVIVKDLGFERVHLVRSGQDETGYRVRIATYRPLEAITGTTEGSNASLDKALLGAVVKVDQLISTLEVNAKPEGALVYVDNERVGTTPLSTQVLPGERVIKIASPGYIPVELTQEIPVRGVVKIDRELEKVPARLVANVSPEGTEVVMDDRVLGNDKLDTGIQPGPHTFRIRKDGYEPIEVKADIKPGDTYTLAQTLKPTPFESFKQFINVAQQDIYARRNYFDASFELINLNGDRVAGRRFGDGIDANSTTSRLLSPGNSAQMMGASIEYGTFFNNYFGLEVVGIGYTTNTQPWRASVQLAPVGGATEVDVRGDYLYLRAVQPQVRVAFWRLLFTLQLGLEVRGGRLLPLNAADGYAEGFVSLDLLASGRISVKFFIVQGLYVQAAWRYTIPIVGFRSAANESASGLRGWSFGLGYAF